MRKREKLDERERERFGRNMAEISGKDGKDETAESGELRKEQGVVDGQNKWAALRGFITQTLEVRQEMKSSKP